MKCSKIQKLIVEYEDQEMPAEIAQHLASCSACNSEYEQTLNLQKLLSLKQYEKPSPEADERRVLSIHRAIQEATARPGEVNRDAWIWLTLEPLPVLRYAIAAVLIAIVGIQLFVMPPKLQPTGEIAISSPTPVDPVETPSMYAEDAAPYQSELYAELQAVPSTTNVDAGSIQYGPHRSAVVDFEY